MATGMTASSALGKMSLLLPALDVLLGGDGGPLRAFLGRDEGPYADSDYIRFLFALEDIIDNDHYMWFVLD